MSPLGWDAERVVVEVLDFWTPPPKWELTWKFIHPFLVLLFRFDCVCGGIDLRQISALEVKRALRPRVSGRVRLLGYQFRIVLSSSY